MFCALADKEYTKMKMVRIVGFWFFILTQVDGTNFSLIYGRILIQIPVILTIIPDSEASSIRGENLVVILDGHKKIKLWN